MDLHEQAIARAESAQQLKDNPMFIAAFADTRAGILEAWAALEKPGEHAEDLHRMVKCLDRVKRCIDQHIDTGKLARLEVTTRARWFNRQA